MAGFTPNEGETLIAQLIHQRIHIDRDATLELGLMTNVAPAETITEATINEPVGTGYARKTLIDASWSVVAGLASYAEQTYIAGIGGWTGAVTGYFVASVSAGGTQRLLYVEEDGAGPFTMTENDEYRVTPRCTVL